jgi:hypothetical protein
MKQCKFGKFLINDFYRFGAHPDPTFNGNALVNASTKDTTQTWFFVPMEHKTTLEKKFKVNFKQMDRNEFFFYEHKLKEFGIPYQKVVQHIGEVVMFPAGVIHFGFVSVKLK